jgi:lycopene cyclase domain-containing protein
MPIDPAYTYLAINLFSLAGPLAYGFTRHSGFNARWRAWAPALVVTATLYIAWDIAFTAWGVWGFNFTYHLGLSLFGLPIEEMLFFLCIPFACLFLHDVAERMSLLHMPSHWARKIWMAIGLGCLLVALFHYSHMYTVSAFGLAGTFSVALSLGWLPPLLGREGHFALTYAIHLIPFFLVNGLLTSLPVVVYNDAENLGLRIGSIPADDAIYSLGLIGLNVFLYEWRLVSLKSRGENLGRAS